MWCRRGLFCQSSLSVEVPASLYVAVVDLMAFLGVAGLDERREQFVVDVDSGLASVTVCTDEADGLGFLLGFLYRDVAGASGP